MPLVLGFNLYRFKPINPANCRSSIHQLFGVLKGHSIARVNLNPAKRGKLVHLHGLLNAKCLVLRRDGT
jgi:hypothetical protein